MSKYEEKRKNPVQLGNDSGIGNDYKPLTIGDISTGLEVNKDRVRFTKEVVTETETTNTLNVSRIKGNRSSGFYEPQFVIQSQAQSDDTTGLWFNVFTNGSSFIKARGTFSSLSIEATSTIYSACGNDDVYGFIWKRGAFTSGSQVTVANLYSTGQFKLREADNAVNSDEAGYGQIWIKSSNPNELYFTNDDGDDIQITDGSSLAGGSGSGDMEGVDLTGGTGIEIASETGTTSGSYSATINCNLEGTELLSTGVTGTTKFLRVDGDNSCSWAVPPDTNTNQLTTFNIGVDTNTSATTIAHGETLTFTGGTGISTETTSDGTITITNTVTDTNTNQLTTFSLTGDSGTPETISQGSTLDIAGGTGINTAVGSTDTVTVSLASGSALTNLGGGSGSTFLKKDGTWATPTDTDTNTNQLTTFNVDADTGTAETIAHGNTLTLTGGTGIDTAVSSTDTVTFALTSGSALSNLGGGSGSTFLKKDGTWATPTDTDTNTNQLTTFDVDADSGSAETIAHGNTLTLTGGTGIDTTVSSTDTVTFALASGASLSNLGGGSGSTFLRKDGTWATPTDTDTNTNQLTTFTLTADSGSNQTIEHGNTLDIAGSSPIVTAVGATDTVTVSLDDPANLTELDESSDATDDKILLWDESGSSWKYMTLDNLQDSIDTTGGGGGGGSNYVTDDADDTMAGTLTIDKDNASTTTSTTRGLYVDLDQTGISAATQAVSNVGSQIDINSDSPTMVGFVDNTGIDLNMVAGTSGAVQFNVGLDANLSGGDINYGVRISTPDVADNRDLQIYSADRTNWFYLRTGAYGATTIGTVDATFSRADLTFDVDGAVSFGSTAVGFEQFEPTFSATNTFVYFSSSGNKAHLTLTGTTSNLNIHFPAHSANCLLVIKQDGTGSRLISAWNARNHGGTPCSGSSTVKWPSNVVPTLSTTGNYVDIVSFYYDADNQIAYGVANTDYRF